MTEHNMTEHKMSTDPRIDAHQGTITAGTRASGRTWGSGVVRLGLILLGGIAALWLGARRSSTR